MRGSTSTGSPRRQLFTTSVTEFGFVYHPLYDLVSGDIVALRRINLVLTMALGVWCAGETVFAVTGARRWLLALCLGAPAMRVFDLWLVTPNYNTLTVQAALVVIAGGHDRLGCPQLVGR